MNISKKKLNMTFEEFKNEQNKVDAMDCKIYAEDLHISEKNFKEDLKFTMGMRDMTLDELMSYGKFWYLGL